MEFTRNEKIAVLQVLDAIVLADGRIDRNEVAFMAMVTSDFGLSGDAVGEARRLDPMLCTTTLRSMSFAKKEYFKQLAVGMAGIDGNIHESELRLISLFFALIN